MNAEQAKKIWQLTEPVKTAMLITQSNGMMQARPMQLVQSEFEGTYYFFTNLKSEKMHEIKNDSDVCLAFSHPDKQTYVSITGKASVTRDRALIEKFWNTFVSAWFPQGKEDPAVGLIQVQVQHAEYWDSSSNTLVQLFEYAKAKVTGQVPDMGNHEKL